MTWHYITLHYITLHYIHYTALHYTALHYTALHYIGLHYITYMPMRFFCWLQQKDRITSIGKTVRVSTALYIEFRKRGIPMARWWCSPWVSGIRSDTLIVHRIFRWLFTRFADVFIDMLQSYWSCIDKSTWSQLFFFRDVDFAILWPCSGVGRASRRLASLIEELTFSTNFRIWPTFSKPQSHQFHIQYLSFYVNICDFPLQLGST